ncbi:fungal cellulose binding domain-containing protein [Ephemerocybe angulata]|uniref:Fungal cellulose binding domain-containing protein n=1 Tax=Ephemerocybe angulata TaxID=980116 RepID=A0A8H6M1E4_9AGAR|nr:fungal cellulose binding domain-containing protein [Tulosesus angulatus]
MLTFKVLSALALAMAAKALPNAAAPAHGKPALPSKSPNYWFSFGDSYTQTGFDPTGVLPSVGNPLGNPPYPGWTSTGGENWVDYVATKYNKSVLLTYNYAYGGAVINETLVTPWQPGLKHLTDQVAQFLEGAGPKKGGEKWTGVNSLFSVFIGINDIGNSWYLEGDRDAFAEVLLDNYFQLVQKLYDIGGRSFLFVLVPPIDRSPMMAAYGPESQAGEKKVLAGFNSRLINRVELFGKSNSGVKTYIYDSVAQYNEILDNPTKYGFKDALSYGPDPDEFWGNDYHPSSYAHKFFGERVAQVLSQTIF